MIQTGMASRHWSMYRRASRRSRSILAERPVPLPMALTASRQLLRAVASLVDSRLKKWVHAHREADSASNRPIALSVS